MDMRLTHQRFCTFMTGVTLATVGLIVAAPSYAGGAADRRDRRDEH